MKAGIETGTDTGDSEKQIVSGLRLSISTEVSIYAVQTNCGE